MKMKFTPVVILLFLLFNAKAQSPISLTGSDMPAIGFSETYAVDTPLTSVSYGNPGANQIYDFSTLTNTHPLTLSYVATSSIYSPNAFTPANQALSSNGSYVVLNSTASKYQAVGLEGYAYGSEVNTPLSPAEDIYHFPEQYQSSFAGSWGFYQAFDGNTVGQSNVDSVREIYTDHFSSLVDGWGKVITPTGSYRALRIKHIDTTVIEVDALYGLFTSSWHTVSGYPLTYITTEYSYVSKETKGAVVSFTYDSTGALLAAQYSLIPPAPPIAGFSFTYGGSGVVHFTDTSEGFPTRFHWNFGDGDTSSSAIPSHTYAANGTYYVCETVYNPSGSSTICDSVHVTSVGVSHLPPIANNDSATVTQPNSTTIAVTLNDHSPSGDAFCVTRVYGGLYFSVLNCNTVAFNPIPSYSGYDTAHYIICNTGQPTLCDTALVIVHVIANSVHQAPVAVNDTVSVLQPGTGNLNVTANDHSPSNDAFCIHSLYGSADFSILNCNNLSFHPDSTFTGNDTVWYVVCNTNQPTLCDTARVIVTVHPNAALLPGTNFTLHQLVCGGLSGVNQSTNADSIVWNFHALPGGISYPDTTFYQLANVQYGASTAAVNFQVCLTTFNKFGSTEKCDTMVTVCEGINEIQLSGVRMYPNPVSSQLSIDMRANTSGINKDYIAIEIYNAIGQRVKTISRNGSADIVNVKVAEFCTGVYLATIIDNTGARQTLGKFTVVQ